MGVTDLAELFWNTILQVLYSGHVLFYGYLVFIMNMLLKIIHLSMLL